MANGLGKDVAVVVLGGIANEALEYASQKISKQTMPVGDVSLASADAVGLGAGAIEVLAGVATGKREIALFGAGGLAIAFATVIGKTLMAYNPLQASAAVKPRTLVADTRPIGSGSQHPAQVSSNTQLANNLFMV